ncbi:MAG: Crp/Fnr family transcriptional regulator [Cellulosilyticum sp.]|nr:Crp/Fnr family transcriptional regulator [Cellulosilyticum sp.]
MHKFGKLFNDLSETTVQHLLTEVPHTVKSFASQETIFTEINYNKQLGILLKGEVQIYITLTTGDRLLLNQLNAGALLGTGYVWGDAEYFPATITAIKPSTVLFLSKTSLKKLFSLEPIILDNYLTAINHSFLHLTNKIELLAIPSVKERLLFMITQACQSNNCISLNKSKLCHELSISRASLYRCLDQLQKEQSIQIHSDGKISLPPSISK